MTSREFNQATGDAKAAADRGPVFVTNRGRPTHVLMNYENYRALVRGTPTLVELLCATQASGRSTSRCLNAPTCPARSN